MLWEDMKKLNLIKWYYYYLHFIMKTNVSRVTQPISCRIRIFTQNSLPSKLLFLRRYCDFSLHMRCEKWYIRVSLCSLMRGDCIFSEILHIKKFFLLEYS